MKRIPLANNKGFALIDDEDFGKVSKHNWHSTNQRCYAITNKKVNGKRTTVLMHRLIMNPRKDKEIDHINGNGIDNRKENLRICTRQQNSMNQKKTRGTSKYKGVSWDKKRKKWVVKIQLKGNLMCLGFFESETRAAETYDEKAKELFGEFANLNFKNPLTK